MAVTPAGTPYVESSDLVANYPGVSLALANHIDGLDGGKVLQVVQGTTTTSTATTSASYVDTTLTVTITPSATSSKILLFTSQNINCDGVGSTVIDWQIVRGSTSIAEFSRYIFSSGSQVFGGTFAASWLDSPATTAATTYKTQFKRSAGSNSISAQNVSSRSMIIAMEVSE